jgi:hypothetical protein
MAAGDDAILAFRPPSLGRMRLWLTLARVRGVFPRTLADRAHFAVPLWRDILTASGCVLGTRDNCRALMGDGQPVMIFPGGAREVFKRKGESYRLIWKERIGFV